MCRCQVVAWEVLFCGVVRTNLVVVALECCNTTAGVPVYCIMPVWIVFRYSSARLGLPWNDSILLVVICYKSWDVQGGGGVQPMVTQGCAYTRSIHFCVIVGLVEDRSCVQCAYTPSIHLWTQSSDGRHSFLFCFVFRVGGTPCAHSLVCSWETLGIPEYIDSAFPSVRMVSLDYNWRDAVTRVSCTLPSHISSSDILWVPACVAELSCSHVHSQSSTTDRTSFTQVINCIDSCILSTRYISVQVMSLNRRHGRACVFDDAFFDQGDMPSYRWTIHQQSVILHRYGYNHTAVKSCRLDR